MAASKQRENRRKKKPYTGTNAEQNLNHGPGPRLRGWPIAESVRLLIRLFRPVVPRRVTQGSAVNEKSPCAGVRRGLKLSNG